MAATREEIQLMLSIIGAQGVDDLRKKYEALAAEQGDLSAAFAAGTLSQKDFHEELSRIAADAKNLEGTLRPLEAALARQGMTAQKAAEDRAKAFDRTIAERLRQQAAEDRAAAAAEARAARQQAADERVAAKAEAAAMRQLAAQAKVAPATAAATAGVYELADAYEVLGVGQSQVIDGVRKVPKAFAWDQITTGARPATDTVVRFGNATIDMGSKAQKGGVATAGGMKNIGQSAYFASQGLEDLQYGIGGVLNNIPTLVMSMGGPMGLAAGISVTAVAAFQLYKHWDQVTGLFQSTRPFAKAADDLGVMQDKLGKVSEELKHLENLGALTTSQFTRMDELNRSEKELKESIKAKETVERLGHLKSDQEEAIARAFEEALKASDSGKVLESLRASTFSGIEDSDKLVAAISEGKIEAYNKLVESLEEGLGKDSKFAAELKRVKPFINKPDLNPFEEMAHDIKQANVEAGLALGKKMTEEGREGMEEMLHGMADEARKGLTEGIGGKLKDTLVRIRAAGSSGKKETAYLTQAIVDELGRIAPELARFPTLAASVAKEMARAIGKSVDDAIEELRRTEGLTKAEALRRLNLQAAEKQQGKTEGLALDEFAQAAARQAQRQARGNPFAPRATPADIRGQAQGMQDALKGLGVDPKQQVQIGKLLNDPRAGRLAPGAIGALQNRGFGQGEALRALPELFRILKGGAAGIEHAADRMAAAAERAGRANFNRAAAGAHAGRAVFNGGGAAPPAGPVGKLPNTAIFEGGNGQADRQDAAQKVIARQKKLDADRNADMQDRIAGKAVGAVANLNGENARLNGKIDAMAAVLDGVNRDVAQRAQGQRNRGRP